MEGQDTLVKLSWFIIVLMPAALVHMVQKLAHYPWFKGSNPAPSGTRKRKKQDKLKMSKWPCSQNAQARFNHNY